MDYGDTCSGAGHDLRGEPFPTVRRFVPTRAELLREHGDVSL